MAKESNETNQERKVPSSASLRTGAPHVAPPDEKQKEQEKKTRGDTQTLRSPASLSAHTMRAKETARAAEGMVAPTAELTKEASDIAGRWWNRVKEDMQALVTPATWASWFPATHGLRLEGRTLVVYVPKAAQEQMEHRWAALIAMILERAARPGLHVRYTQEET